MQKRSVSQEEAQSLLERNGGKLRNALGG